MDLGRTAGLAATILLVGVGGYFLGVSTEREDRKLLAAPKPKFTEPNREARPPVPPPAVPKTDVQLNLAMPGVARLRLLKQLQEEGVLHRSNFNFFGRDGRISDSFATLADLSPAERAEMQATLDRARRRIDDLILANAKVLGGDVESFEIAIKPFEQGVEVYDQMMDSLRRVLGDDRYSVFAALAGDALAKLCDNYGAEQRKVRIWRTDREGPDMIGVAQHNVGYRSQGRGQATYKLHELPLELRWLSAYGHEIAKLPVLPANRHFNPFDR